MPIKLGKGWAEFGKAFNGRKARRELNKQTRKTVQRQLSLLRGDMVRYIVSVKHGIKNSPLTIMAKGSSKPLIDRGDLIASFAFRTKIRDGP